MADARTSEIGVTLWVVAWYEQCACYCCMCLSDSIDRGSYKHIMEKSNLAFIHIIIKYGSIIKYYHT